jgi:hypothetical protein
LGGGLHQRGERRAMSTSCRSGPTINQQSLETCDGYTMKLLVRSTSSEERARIKTLLEDRGIPVFEQPGYRTVAEAALFVCINEQYDEAIAVLRNDRHEVRNPIDVEAFEAAKRSSGLSAAVKYSLLVLLLVVIVWAAVTGIAWFFGSASTPHRWPL